MVDFEAFLDQLLSGYQASYDIERIEGATEGLVAKAHMHVTECQCMIFEEFKMWTADADEYVYIYKIPHLTSELVDKYIKESYDDGFPKIKLDHVSIRNQHMRTNLVALFLVDEADDEAIKIVKKCKIYKNFAFSFKGWMEMHTAILNLTDGSIANNRYGRSTGEYLKIHIDHYRSNVNK